MLAEPSQRSLSTFTEPTVKPPITTDGKYPMVHQPNAELMGIEARVEGGVPSFRLRSKGTFEARQRPGLFELMSAEDQAANLLAELPERISSFREALRATAGKLPKP